MSIKVRNLTHVYNEGLPYESPALTDVSFDIEDGEFVGVIGHTGSGKSTLLQHLNGLMKAKSGTIEISGTDITKPGVSMMDIRKKIGLVFQYPEYQLFEETVAKDIAFGPSNLGLSKEEIDVRVRESLELVGFDAETMGERSPFDLSGGQKRRIAIAGVLAMRPEVLILDEPTAGLDPTAHADILETVKRIHKSTGNITILVSHNMGDIARLADKVLVMQGGRLLMQGTPREVFSREEELSAVGLALPPTARLLSDLKKAGLDVRTDIFTAEEAEKEICRALEKRR